MLAVHQMRLKGTSIEREKACVFVLTIYHERAISSLKRPFSSYMGVSIVFDLPNSLSPSPHSPRVPSYYCASGTPPRDLARELFFK